MKLRIRLLIPLAAALCAQLSAEDNLRYGQPACGGQVLDKKYFVICYDADRKTPSWVGYALTKDDATTRATDRVGDFRADTSLPRGQRAENADYASSGYDKGHMAPANDFKRSKEAMKATFVLTNAVPQKHGVNGGEWAELEGAVHDLAAQRGTVWVFSGPIFAGKKAVKAIGRNKVAVPTHTYKVVLCVRTSGEKEMFGYILPNVDRPASRLAGYALPVSRIEKETGLDFFTSLSGDERKRLAATTSQLPEPAAKPARSKGRRGSKK